MSRITAVFSDAKVQGRRLLIPYLMAGDPNPAETVALMHALVDAGADLLELGLPFSDPIADGPAIQAACERALRAGMNTTGALEILRRFRERDVATPVILMGYLNPILALGAGAFAERAAAAGADGVITVDLPPEEGGVYLQALTAAGLDPVFLVAPTTDESRRRTICAQASGFVYYVSLKGVTGAASLDVEDVGRRVARLREVTDLPVAVGFGVSGPSSAAALAKVADAVVVGSALVKRVAELGRQPERMREDVARWLREMRLAIDAVSAAASADRSQGGKQG